MLALTRKNKIRDIVFERKSITVAELAKMFSVTEETIRRDLKSLEDAGVLTRTYGGAFVQDGVKNDISISVREDVMVHDKKLIAQECRKLIKNGDTISLDASTTAFHICNEIKSMRVTVLTNSIAVVNFLKDYENITLICTGGTITGANGYFAGKTARANIESYFVDKAFISCRSVDIMHGVTDSNEEMAEFRRMYNERANKTYLIADHTKFDKVSFIKICSFDMITGIVTDKPPSNNWYTALENIGVRLFVVHQQ